MFFFKCVQRHATHICLPGSTSGSGGVKRGRATNRLQRWQCGGIMELCRVEEHQHQLAHLCLPNIVGIWKWGICGLMGRAFIT